MKRRFVKVPLLLVGILAIGSVDMYAFSSEKKKEIEKCNDCDLAQLVINGTNNSNTFWVSSEALKDTEISIQAPNGFSVFPTTIPANSKKQKVTVTLNSTLKQTQGEIVLKCGEKRSYIQIKGYGTALPVKDISASPISLQSKNEKEFSQTFCPSDDGYTIEFRVKMTEPGQSFYPYFVDDEGYGVKAYISSNEIGLYSSIRKKGISNPETAHRQGGTGKFYNKEGEAYTYRFAVTPDHRAFIYRDGMPIDTVRLADYGAQPNFADGIGEFAENMLRNPGFEGEFDVNPESKLATRIEGWDIVIGDRWNSEQIILPQEINEELDVNNHIFQIKPYKWSGNTWSDGILEQVVDVVPNETYTLSALLKGGLSQKQAVNTGKMIIQEMQDSEKRAVTEIVSDTWETYSMDYTTSSDCKQLRISFSVGRGGWGNDITPVQVDNAKLTGVKRIYSPKFGFENQNAELEYFTVDESGAYAPLIPTMEINIGK